MPDLSARPPLTALASRPWDVVVVGGGITGAGILREAARRGLQTLLVERDDFASGTSSRSSKLVHGGLHYLARGELGLARRASRDRERLLAASQCLVQPLEFLIPTRPREHRNRWRFRLGIAAYALVSGRLPRPARVSRHACVARVPGLGPDFDGGFRYVDARTDDARLVLRVLREAGEAGGVPLNYVEAVRLLRDPEGRIVGVRLRDRIGGVASDVRARAVVNATGPWADELRSELGRRSRVRRIRGSHLVLSRGAVPVSTAVVALHPDSGLPFYLIPWQGVTLVGSTHVEEGRSGPRTPRITPEESAYLLRGLRELLPGRPPGPIDVLSTFSGVRPVVDAETGSAARASRDHGIWQEDGLLTVTGGKLTTFHSTARRVLQVLAPRFPRLAPAGSPGPPLRPVDPCPEELPLPGSAALRIRECCGPEALGAVAAAPPRERERLPGLHLLRAELRWIAEREGVRHLDDLLLRRLRLGLTLPRGGLHHLPAVGGVVRGALGWSDRRWAREVASYLRRWHAEHGPTEGDPSRTGPGGAAGSGEEGAGGGNPGAPRARLSSPR